MDDVPEEVDEAIDETIKQTRIESLDANYDFNRGLIEAAYDETPLMGTKGEYAIDTRLLVIREYLQSKSQPSKRDGSGRIRSKEKSRLDRSFNRVAAVTDRSECTIKNQCVHSVYSGENKTEQFLNDLRRVETRLKSTGSRKGTGPE